MSIATEILGLIKDILTLNERQLAAAVDIQRLTSKVEDVDRRLVRIETLVELTQFHRLPRPG